MFLEAVMSLIIAVCLLPFPIAYPFVVAFGVISSVILMFVVYTVHDLRDTIANIDLNSRIKEKMVKKITRDLMLPEKIINSSIVVLFFVVSWLLLPH